MSGAYDQRARFETLTMEWEPEARTREAPLFPLGGTLGEDPDLRA